MASKVFLNFKQNEELCEEVRKYPVLYDKSLTGYKERNAVANAWNEVAKQLTFTEKGKENTYMYRIYYFTISGDVYE